MSGVFCCIARSDGFSRSFRIGRSPVGIAIGLITLAACHLPRTPLHAKRLTMAGSMPPIQSSPAITKFHALLSATYGERLERVVLYGSHARGDARADSDYDIAVFLKDLVDRWAESDRIAEMATEILQETGAVIHAMPYAEGAYRERSPLMHEIRREGLDL